MILSGWDPSSGGELQLHENPPRGLRGRASPLGAFAKLVVIGFGFAHHPPKLMVSESLMGISAQVTQMSS